ncbi:2Fe-2S iron-sulfur cluster-binding protein [Thioalkalivibrio sp. HK1]|uniref:2Fe-2S iron-sulfur cluster-binding protein n=1 Tax=Thioalkalivibrio sp. HK1 TaxID=1469245 RepID=UPI00046F6FA8|nr:2Fe-2S iron-sulfur cluster-binding protein [Thioalkalivibrio sp. HK1]
MDAPSDTPSKRGFGTVTLSPSGHRFDAKPGQSILEAALRAGRSPAFGCANGSCGECRAKVLSGKTERIRFHDYAFSDAEKIEGWILPCSVAPVGEVVIESTEALGVDDIAHQRVRARIIRIERTKEDPLVLSVHIKLRRARVLRYLSGQRVRLHIEGGPTFETWLASCPCESVDMRVHLRLGDHLAHAFFFEDHAQGARLEIEGPTGRFVLDDPGGRTLIFIAFDTAFAPIESLIEHVINREFDVPIRLARVQKGVPYRHDHCRAWADALDDFRYYPIAANEGEPSDSIASRVCESALCEISPGQGSLESRADAYLAGPSDFVAACREELIRRGLCRHRIKTDCL